LLWAFTALLLYAIALVSVWAVHQRNRRLEERGLAKQALQQAAEDLDCRIAQRTEELTRANSDVKARYTKLQETEHLLRSTQNELVQAGKLTMLGQMAAGVTHELNQPLTAIRAFADNARTFLERDQQQRVEQNLSHISAAAERMGAIIGQLKGFARKSDAALDTVDLAQSIRASALLLESDFQKAGASLQFDMPQTVQVSGDAVRIEQVLINLMRNALDAVKSSEVKTVVVSLEQDGTDALVRVADSGPGIADDVAQRLFEPFFSTKGSGEGLGLGLAISSSIVQALNGRLTAANRQTDGAVPGAEFSLWLPLAMQRSGAQQPLKVRPM
jgi:two-component system C4-dicarboxylate transport sensor histidine kinase DctB